MSTPPNHSANTDYASEVPKVADISAGDFFVHHSSDVQALLQGFIDNKHVFRNMSVTLLPTSDWIRAGNLPALFFEASKCKLFFGGGTEATLATQWIIVQGRNLGEEALKRENINKFPQTLRYESWQDWLLNAVRMYLFPHEAEGDVAQEMGAHFGIDLVLFLQEVTQDSTNYENLRNEAKFLLDEIMQRKLNNGCDTEDLLLVKDENLLNKLQNALPLTQEELLSERRHFLEKIWALRTSDDSLDMGVCEFVVECPASTLLGIQGAPEGSPHKKGMAKALIKDMQDKLSSEGMSPLPFVESFGGQLEESGHSWKMLGFKPVEDEPRYLVEPYSNDKKRF